MKCSTAKPVISPLAMGASFSLNEPEETIRYHMNLVMMTFQAFKRAVVMVKRGTFVFRLTRVSSSHWISSARWGIIRNSERKGNPPHTTCNAPRKAQALGTIYVTPRTGMPRSTSKKNWELIMRWNSRAQAVVCKVQTRSCRRKNRMLRSNSEMLILNR